MVHLGKLAHPADNVLMHHDLAVPAGSDLVDAGLDAGVLPIQQSAAADDGVGHDAAALGQKALDRLDVAADLAVECLALKSALVRIGHLVLAQALLAGEQGQLG